LIRQKQKVAKFAMVGGAEIVNDISALHGDKEMTKTIKDAGAAVILMHMRGKPETCKRQSGL